MAEETRWSVLSRRQALTVIGAAGAVSLVGLGRRGRALAASCATTPSETEGPYWVDELLQRTDITVDPSDGSVKPGVPLQLNINVLRTDDSCAPAAGVQVNVWHCDAGGLYSDEAANGTIGKKFLRGYQVTDANGAVRFTTIYPGWYSGRTIHIHFRIRTFDGSTTTYNFTSQVYFDDTVSDQVLAASPYDTRGTRNTTNSNDTIYQAATLLTLVADGSGGYVGTYDVGLAGLPATSSGGGGGTGSCSDVTTCGAALTAALPDPSTATSRKGRRVASRLARIDARASAALTRAASVSGGKQTRLYAKARAELAKLVTVAAAADDQGVLDGSLSSIQQAVTALLAVVPS
jgi:protocatechuate 3,4-dioxygenase beta subunit